MSKAPKIGSPAYWQRFNLHTAAERGDLKAVQRWLAHKYPVNRFDELGKTPLHYAAENEHLEVAKLLIECGANVNAHDESMIGNTPLGDIADTCSLQMARLLIEAGGDPAIPGWMQLTALDRASQRKTGQGPAIYALLRDAVNKKASR